MTVKTSVVLRSALGLTAILSLYALCTFVIASLAVFALLFGSPKHEVVPKRQPDKLLRILLPEVEELETPDDAVADPDE